MISDIEFAEFAVLGGVAPIVMALSIAMDFRNEYKKNKRKFDSLPQQLALPSIK